MSSTSVAEKVLVTGASGYIAVHVVNQLFAGGFDIVGTVRSSEKGDWLAQRYPGFKYEIVKDLTNENAFDQVFQKHSDIKRVLHTASPVSYAGTDFIKGLVEPAVAGTTSVLKAAHKYGKNVEKVVVTSSVVAALVGNDFKNPSSYVDENSWNEVTAEQAATGWGPGYAYSKVSAEKAVWEFKKTAIPAFSIATVLVPLVYGPPIHQTTYSAVGSSVGFFKNLLSLPIDTKEVPTDLSGHADVRDVARFHIQAVQNDKFDGGRWLIIAGRANDQVTLDIIHKYRSKEAAGVTKGDPGSFNDEDYYRYDNSKTLKNIDFDFIPFIKSVLDEFDALKQLEASE